MGDRGKTSITPLPSFHFSMSIIWGFSILKVYHIFCMFLSCEVVLYKFFFFFFYCYNSSLCVLILYHLLVSFYLEGFFWKFSLRYCVFEFHLHLSLCFLQCLPLFNLYLKSHIIFVILFRYVFSFFILEFSGVFVSL